MKTIIDTELFNSEAIQSEASSIFETAIGIMSMDPIAAIKAVKEINQMPIRVRDSIFLESLKMYLINLNKDKSDGSEHIVNNLQKFSEVLAEVTPNEDAQYIGNPDRMREYSKRIIKVLDDCGTIQKAIYIANLSRALANRLIDKNCFFKLCQCIRILTDEDLLLLKKYIPKDIINDDEMYIDDFRGVGLLYEVDGGFAYSKRAYDLVNYALDYENGICVPDSFPDRQVLSVASMEEAKSYIGI